MINPLVSCIYFAVWGWHCLWHLHFNLWICLCHFYVIEHRKQHKFYNIVNVNFTSIRQTYVGRYTNLLILSRPWSHHSITGLVWLNMGSKTKPSEKKMTKTSCKLKLKWSFLIFILDFYINDFFKKCVVNIHTVIPIPYHLSQK